MSNEITNTLESVQRRMIRQRWWSAVAAIAAVIVSGAILLATIDFALRISDPGLRWILTACWAVMATLAIYRFGIVPLRQRITPLHVARQVENEFPQFGDRLASALQFARQADTDPLAGSSEMRRAVVADTTTDIEQLPPDAWNRVIDSTPLRKALTSAGVIGGLAVIAMIVSPTISQLAVARLAQPWRQLPWPRVNQLEIVEAPSRLAKGQTFEALVADRQGQLPDNGQIHYRFPKEDDNSVESFPLQTVGEQLLARRENVQRSFAYRITGGDDDTMPWHDVTVVDPPQLVSLDITAKPPAYSGLPKAKLERHLRILAGTELTADGVANEPLKTAAIEVIEGSTIPANSEGRGFTISDWSTNASIEKPESTYYRVNLQNRDGVSGASQSWALRIDPDSPPTVEWKEPASDQFVLAKAVVPVRVAIADNLAIKNAAILYHSIDSEEESDPQRIEIYAGPEVPPTHPAYEPQEIRDRREIEYAWDLSPLKLPPGSEISVIVEASDYKPGVGKTALPRRIRILTLDEFDSRLAERQTRIVRQLEQALAQQRTAQQRTRQIELDTAAKPTPSRGDIDQLAANSLDQRQIGQRLVDPEEGAIREIESLRNDLTNNRLDRPELNAQLQDIESELTRLSKTALPQADGNLNAARKSAESLARSEDAAAKEALAKSLADAGRSQTEVASTLEKLIGQLQQWSDFQRFAREVTRLREEQSELRKATQTAAAQTAAASPQSRQAQAERQRIAEQQSDLARRLDRLHLDMEGAAKKPEESGAASDNIADALEQSRDQGTAGKLREAARELQSDRLGRAAEVQQQAEEDLQALLDTLRGRTAGDPEQLAEQLRDAQEELTKLREDLAELNREAQQQSTEATQPKQESLAEQIARAARRMMRMGAQQAGQSTQQASQSLQQSDPEQTNPQEQQANRDQADKQLAQALAQLQEQIRQAERQVAERKLDGLAKQVAEYIERQREVLTKTVQLEDAPQVDSTRALAAKQGELETAVRNAAKEFAGQPVFEMALGGITDEMQRAAKQLAAGDTGRSTQQAEHTALTRLGHISDVLRNEDNPQEEPGADNAGGQGGESGQGGEQPASPIDLAELKMLRFMQAELNQLTRIHEANLAEQETREPAENKTAELSAEQERLANLVDEMIRRLSKPPTPQN